MSGNLNDAESVSQEEWELQKELREHKEGCVKGHREAGCGWRAGAQG